MRHWLVSPVAGVMLLLASVFFARFFDAVTPIKGWLSLDLVKIWSWQVLLSAACVSFGCFFLERVLRFQSLGTIEKIAYAFPVGLVAFVTGMYGGGFLGLYGPVFAVVLPVGLLAAGLRHLLPVLREVATGDKTLRWWSLVGTVYGALCLGILYLGILSPDSLNYDSTWNHLVIAQDYARAGRIIPFPGDWVKNVPHLGSIVNTWAFLVPGFEHPAQRWMMALHNEFNVLLWTLVGVAAGARWMSERKDLKGTWAVFFFFPGIFVYDGNLGAAADHFLAVFTVPVFLAAAAFMQRPRWQNGVLLGILAGGALLTKLHAVYFLIPITGLIAIQLGRIVVSHVRAKAKWVELRPVPLAVVAGAATAVLLLSMHFGKNAVFYQNPFYPMAQGRFHSVPTVPDAELHMDYLFADWRSHVPKELGARLWAALKMVFTFSFIPHYTFMGDVPTFGSLFTLFMPFAVFLGRARRIWFGIAIGAGAVFIWATTFYVDRNLQTFAPLLAAVTAAVLVRAWELGNFTRVGLSACIAIQLAWAGDYYFSGSDRIANAISLIRSELDNQSTNRYARYRSEYVELGRSLPRDAVVALHHHHVMLGIDRPVLLDWMGFQGIIDYRTFKTPHDLHMRLKEIGVTHVVWLPGVYASGLRQEEVIFGALAARYAGREQRFGSLSSFALDAEPPKQVAPFRVLTWDMPGYSNGVYPVERLSVNEEMPPEFRHYSPPERPTLTPDAIAPALEGVDAVLAIGDASWPAETRASLLAKFQQLPTHHGFALYLRASHTR